MILQSIHFLVVSGRPQESRPLHPITQNGTISAPPQPTSGNGFPLTIKEEHPTTHSSQQSQQFSLQNHSQQQSQRQPNGSCYNNQIGGKIIDAPRVIVSTRQPTSSISTTSMSSVSTTTTITTTTTNTSVSDGQPNGSALMTAYSHRSLMSMGGEMATQYGTASMPNALLPATNGQTRFIPITPFKSSSFSSSSSPTNETSGPDAQQPLSNASQENALPAPPHLQQQFRSDERIPTLLQQQQSDLHPPPAKVPRLGAHSAGLNVTSTAASYPVPSVSNAFSGFNGFLSAELSHDAGCADDREMPGKIVTPEQIKVRSCRRQLRQRYTSDNNNKAVNTAA